jgi:hypothetical protein
MRDSVSGYWFEALYTALIAAALPVFAVSRAEATCGDWLAHPSATAMSQYEHLDHSTAATHPSSNDQRRSARLPLSKPCHGPLCRSAPSQPAPPAPANISFQTEKLALFEIVDTYLADCRRFYNGDDSQSHPLRGFPPRIDHPPRV